MKLTLQDYPTGLNEVLDHIIYHNSLRQWLYTMATAAIIIAGLKLLRMIIIRRLRKIAMRSASGIDDLIVEQIEKSVLPYACFIVAFLALQRLSFPERTDALIRSVMMVITVFYVIKVITSIVKFFVQSLSRRRGDDHSSKASRGIIFIVNSIIWICGVLFLIDNFGFDITTIVAGLGIGGIAIAMASQNILGDLFNYLAIYFDKPFEHGDFIVVEDKMGVVEHIGIRTTRLRTLSGEELVCSNSDLTSARVHNFKRMQERRALFNVGVVYHTPLTKLRSLPVSFRRIIESIPGTRFDRAHFRSFGESSLDFEVVYYITSVDYGEYMDIQQKINLAIFELFEKESIEFAFPTQTIVFDTNEESKSAKPGWRQSPHVSA